MTLLGTRWLLSRSMGHLLLLRPATHVPDLRPCTNLSARCPSHHPLVICCSSIVCLAGMLPNRSSSPGVGQSSHFRREDPFKSWLLSSHGKRETPPPFLSPVVHPAFFFLPTPSPSDQHLPQTQSHPTVAASSQPEEKRSPSSRPSTSLYPRAHVHRRPPLSFRSDLLGLSGLDVGAAGGQEPARGGDAEDHQLQPGEEVGWREAQPGRGPRAAPPAGTAGGAGQPRRAVRDGAPRARARVRAGVAAVLPGGAAVAGGRRGTGGEVAVSGGDPPRRVQLPPDGARGRAPQARPPPRPDGGRAQVRRRNARIGSNTQRRHNTRHSD
jgi:hypothetical protein